MEFLELKWMQFFVWDIYWWRIETTAKEPKVTDRKRLKDELQGELANSNEMLSRYHRLIWKYVNQPDEERSKYLGMLNAQLWVLMNRHHSLYTIISEVFPESMIEKLDLKVNEKIEDFFNSEEE